MKFDKQTGIIIAVVVVGLAFAAFNPFSHGSTVNAKPSTSKQQSTGSQQSGQQHQSSSKKVKLENTRYAPYSYKISGDSLSSSAKRALAGFTVSRSTSNGVKTVKLNAKKPEYQDQTYHLKNGEQLYFIETSYGDDSASQEYAMSDDTAVVVDSDGYVVRS
ncbi:MAG: hypothetical protein ABEJ99_04810 [Candidatus Nanohaloarchaea archaeon]